MERTKQPDLSVWTIGHSNHSIERFVKLLTMHNIEEIVDTRSHPFSKHAPQFDREQISALISRSDISYVYLGQQLGGRPSEREYYEEDGRLAIDLVWESWRFKQGITRLMSEIRKGRIALLCAEENPVRCHRRRLITPVLIGQSVSVWHVRGDSTVQTEAELARETDIDEAQMPLFPGSAFARR